MSGVIGNKVKMSIFGESHGKSIGVVINGLPSGFVLDLDKIDKEMKRRAPGQNLMSTQRNEKDKYIIQSGLFEGKLTGTPLCALIPNSDQHSKDYSLLKDVMRPGHADYSGKVHYKGANDYRGGGSFSGRLTAPLVFMGAIAKQILETYGIKIGAHIASINNILDTKFNPLGEDETFLESLSSLEMATIDSSKGKLMKECILKAREDSNSVGGSIECIIQNVPVGVGDPYFDSVESRLAHVLFSVPAVKGLEFGLGFDLTKLTGKEANDEMEYDENGNVRNLTNNNGGVLGGIANGMPILFKVGIKPTPSISLEQKTINVKTKENTTIKVVGRHDPCIVQRAVPVIEAVAAFTILDFMLEFDINNKWR